MIVKIKKLHPEAVIPVYAQTGDAGLDLTAISIDDCSDWIEYRTGLSFEIPFGYVGLLFSRSSVTKKDLSLANSVGVVDSGYRGEITFRFKRTKTPCERRYGVGDRVGQLLILPYPQITLVEASNLSSTPRGVGGYGSTGA